MSKSYMNGGGGVEKWSKILNFPAYVRVYAKKFRKPLYHFDSPEGRKIGYPGDPLFDENILNC